MNEEANINFYNIFIKFFKFCVTDMMRFLCNKLSAVMIIVMTALCLVSIGIATRTSIVMIEKQDQVIKPVPDEQKVSAAKAHSVLNVSKLQDQVLYFNGKTYEGLNAYSSSNDGLFIPIDEMLARLGIKFNWYSSDDLLEFSISGKRVLIKLGQKFFRVDNEKISLNAAPAAAKNHVLVPAELIMHIDGFYIDFYSKKKTVFMDYYHDYETQADKLKFLGLTAGKAYISDFDGRDTLWSGSAGREIIENLEPSPDNSAYLLKSDGKVYIIKTSGDPKPYLLDVPASAQWSSDSRYLHWVDYSKKISYVYDFRSSSVKRLGDYYFRISSGAEGRDRVYGGDILFDFSQGRRFKRVSFANTDGKGNYTFIDRRGKTVVEGNVEYSPDKHRVLFYKSGEGYYTANSDGTKVVPLGEGIGAHWINNNSIILRVGGSLTLVSHDGKIRKQVDSDWLKVGYTPEGGVLFTGGNTLYRELDGKEEQILQLPWKCDYANGLSTDGPYTAISKDADGVFYISGSDIVNIGPYSLLIDDYGTRNANGIDVSGISSSPDGKQTAFLFKEADFAVLKVIGPGAGEPERIVLNYLMEGENHIESCSMKWISESSLVIFTPKRGWLINLNDGVKIKEWRVDEDNVVRDILLP